MTIRFQRLGSIAACACATTLLAQSYQNGPVITHPNVGLGGSDLSLLQFYRTGQVVFGWGNQQQNLNRLADDVNLPDDTPLKSLQFYQFFQAPSPVAKPFDLLTARVWDGDPRLAGSKVLSVFSAFPEQTPTTIFRSIDTQPFVDSQRLWLLKLPIENGPILQAGKTYWIEWQPSVVPLITTGAFVPPTTRTGAKSLVRGSAALQKAGFQPWAPIVDQVPQDLPFYINRGPWLIQPVEQWPAELPPDQPFSFDLTIEPLSDMLSATPRLCFREADATPFSCIDLVPLAGTRWRATLPAFSCQDSPSLYIEAVGSEDGVIFFPVDGTANPIRVRIANPPEILIAASFDTGLPSGWSSSGLWTTTAAQTCAPAPSCQGSGYAYYGIPAQCNYNNGTTNKGSLFSQVFTVPPDGASLTFCYRYQGEGGRFYDEALVRVNGQTIFDLARNRTDSFIWEPVTLSLDTFAGQSIQIEWYFDTIDGVANDFLGVLIDDVRVAARQAGSSLTIASVNFDEGLPPGWSATGLWKTADECFPPSCQGGSYAYYGVPLVCSIDDGQANEGTLSSPVYLIPDEGAALEFCYQYDAEGTNTFPIRDMAQVIVNDEVIFTAGATAIWTPALVHLDEFAGLPITINFRFITGDALFNDGKGWAIDDLKIRRFVPECTLRCQADCDEDSTLNIDDFVCYQTAFALGESKADCNQDGSLNIDDFICFQTYFAVGC